MGFRSVFEKTLTDLTGWKSALWMIPLMAVFMVGSVWMACAERQASLQMRTYFTTSQLLLLAYFVLSGFFIAMLVSSSAAGFVAKEEDDGTLLIWPASRSGAGTYSWGNWPPCWPGRYCWRPSSSFCWHWGRAWFFIWKKPP